MPVTPEETQLHFETPCITADQLYNWIQVFMNLKLPRESVCPHHAAPFDYVKQAYFQESPDLIVWASRGGGKTRLAALVTLLDLLHKPGCAVRILGGSLEQSLKMWEHLLPDIQNLCARHLSKSSRLLMRRVAFKNASNAAVLTQSEFAVRGLRVQKLRCDEVDLFKPGIWEAAQFTTRSKKSHHVPISIRRRHGSSDDVAFNEMQRAAREAGQPKKEGEPFLITGAIEALSTFHKPHGMMKRIIDRAIEQGKPILKWCLLEVLEKCPPERDCDSCPLLEECGGIAKTRCDGFFPIDDAIAQKSRVSRDAWQAEMLCNRPLMVDSVFPNFDPHIHVRQNVEMRQKTALDLAIDFGFHNPFVCLWIRDDGTICHVIDEYVQEQQVMSNHVAQIESRRHGTARRICCDPAGAGRNDQTAESNIQYLKRHGYTVLSRASRIIDGLEMIRTGLQPALGNPTLFIHPKCKRTIAALEQLRYPKDGELPVKDGTHDHLVDALRYFYVNRGRSEKNEGRRY